MTTQNKAAILSATVENKAAIARADRIAKAKAEKSAAAAKAAEVAKGTLLLDRAIAEDNTAITEKLADIQSAALSAAEDRIDLPVAPPCVSFEPDQTSFFLKSAPDSFMFTIDNGYSIYSDKLVSGTNRPYIGTIFAVDTIEGRKLAKCPIGTISLNNVSLNNDALSVEIFGKIGREASMLGATFSREKFKQEIEQLACYRIICEKQQAKAEATAKKEKINQAFKQIALSREDLSKYY